MDVVALEDDAFEDAEDARLVDAACAEGGPTVPIEEIKRELGLRGRSMSN